MPMLAALCAVATSTAQAQSPVVNNQIQLGDVFATQTLNVVTVEEGVGAETNANGNAVVAAVDRTNMSVTSNQTMAGATSAWTVVNATGSMGESSQVNTTATGNIADISASQGTVTGVLTQIATAAPTVTARGQIEGETAEAGDIGLATTAASNSAGINLVNGSAGVRVNQSSNADVLADGGAIVQYVSGTADVSGVAAGNSVALIGTQSSAARIATSQTNGGQVQASQFTAYGNAQTAVTSTSASGNVVGAVNDGPLLDVTSNQYNDAYIRSQAEGSAYQYGTAAVVAYGVGNSVLAGNNGESVVLDNVQLNTGGGVEVIAGFSGQTGYDASSRATAIGNDATAYSCSSCTGSMNIDSRQTNNSDVGATSTTSLGGGARSVNSSSQAIGNNASFYVSRPGS